VLVRWRRKKGRDPSWSAVARSRCWAWRDCPPLRCSGSESGCRASATTSSANVTARRRFPPGWPQAGLPDCDVSICLWVVSTSCQTTTSSPLTAMHTRVGIRPDDSNRLAPIPHAGELQNLSFCLSYLWPQGWRFAIHRYCRRLFLLPMPT